MPRMKTMFAAMRKRMCAACLVSPVAMKARGSSVARSSAFVSPRCRARRRGRAGRRPRSCGSASGAPASSRSSQRRPFHRLADDPERLEPRAAAGPATGSRSAAQSSTARTLSISGVTRSKSHGTGSRRPPVPARSASSSSQSAWSRRAQSSSPAASKPLAGELADRLEHPETLLAVPDAAATDQALVEQRRRACRGPCPRPLRPRRGCSRRGRPRAGRRAAVRRVEQVVAPRDRRAQRGWRRRRRGRP